MRLRVLHAFTCVHSWLFYLTDFDAVHYGIAAHDWAHFFVHSLLPLESVPEADVIGRLEACKKHKLHLVEMYLKHVAKLEGRPESTVTAIDVETFYEHVLQIENIILLPWRNNVYACKPGSSIWDNYWTFRYLVSWGYFYLVQQLYAIF